MAYKSGGTTTRTEYAGNKVYKNGTLSMILTGEGYATLPGSTPAYYYYLRDHQGNNRVVINQAGTVQQVNHYYPFGGLFGEGIQDSNQPYRYSGKELDRLFGLDMYDFHWRQYMADLGRTTTPDPMSEVLYPLSPFVYTSNNPVNRTDPTGMLDDWVEDKDKHVYWDENAVSESTTKEGESYIGKTVYATGEDGEFKYGDQYGNWHDSAPLGEISVSGFRTSGKGPVSTGIRSAARGYDPGWIIGFNQFVDAGLAAINMTLSAATLAANTGSAYNGLRARAALSTTGNAAKTVPQYTKSSLKLGQQMHKSYKVGADGIKEFRLPSGKRVDFLDINNRAIYELKPFNPRAMQQGQKQLNMYMQELQTMPQFKGINWKTVLDTY